ncbi:cellobiose dehydrogenase [Diplocarpon rosae]|nr:cellobiose dehydrogenase [Diplocarpon rosae]
MPSQRSKRAPRGLLGHLAVGLGLFSTTAHGQSTAYADAATGITFQQVTEGTFTFGIALPETASTDFIGRISTTGAAGWAGISLKGPMTGSLMVVAWPNAEQVVASLRLASGYSNPGVFTGSASLKPIPAGTTFDGTTYTYTFLCEGCLQTDGSTFAADAATANLGWAHADKTPTPPAEAGATLGYHSTGFGLFGVDLAGAKSASFATWAALAQADSATPAPTPVGSTLGAVNGTTNGTTTGPTGPATTANATYDYIVVGGGPAGLVTSQRLIEAGHTVLLLERGPASTASTGGRKVVPWNSSLTFYDVPGVFISLTQGTEGEAYCTDTAAVAGCVLGGGGSVNGMAFIHPPHWDFDDAWPTGWKWADMAPAAERLYARNPGTTLPSRDGIWYDNQSAVVLSSWLETNGWNFADAMQNPDDKAKSFGPPQMNIAGGLRSGPIHTYLPLAQASPNFKLQLETKVIRVLRNGSTITGVETETATGREIINLKTGGAVLLSSGVMSTPRLLINSGIGPAAQINTVKASATGVTVPESDWISLPVGSGVKDHSRIVLTFNVTAGLQTYSSAQLLNPAQADIDLFNQGSGVLTQSFQRLDTWTRINTTDGHSIMFQAQCNSFVNDTVQYMLFITHGLTSTGELAVNSDGNTPLTFSGGANATAESIMAGGFLSVVHMVGSAKIGTDDGRQNGSAVVDLDTKVYGTDNLFVVDASMHADVPTGNSQAIIMIAAERAVEKILALRGTAGYPTGTPAGTPTSDVPPAGTPSSGVISSGVPTYQTNTEEDDTCE